MKIFLKGVAALVLLMVSVPGTLAGALWRALQVGFAAGEAFVDWVSEGDRR